MTGNIVLLGFAFGGAKSLSIGSSGLSLAAFIAGAVVGGRFSMRLGSHKGRLLTTAIIVEAVLVVVALLVAASGGTQTSGASHYILIALLAAAMGLQNAVARHSGVSDVTTTVLTMTLSGLAAESPLAGGNNPHLGRRVTAVAAMIAGALAGGLLVVRFGITAALVLALGLLLYSGFVSLRLPASGQA